MQGWYITVCKWVVHVTVTSAPYQSCTHCCRKKNPNYLFTVPARKALKQLLTAFVACKFVTPTVLQLSRLLTTVLFSTALRCSTTEDSLKLLLTNHRRFYARACLRVLPRVYEPNLNGLWPEPPAWLAKTSTQGRSFKAIAVSFKKKKRKEEAIAGNK